MKPTDDQKPLSSAEPATVPDPARPALPPITRVNSRILYAAAIFGLLVIWVVTFTVTSRHPQTKPPAPPQTQDATPNLDSLASLAERLRVAQEMQKKLDAAPQRPAPFDPFRSTTDSTAAEEDLAVPRRDPESAGPQSRSLPPVRYAAEAPQAPPPPSPAPGKSRYEQALTAPPLIAPAGRSSRTEASEPATDPTSRLVDLIERRMPAGTDAPDDLFRPAGSATEGASLTPHPAAEPRLVRPRTALSPYVLFEGTILPAVLSSELTSDLPGIVTATLRSPVYDSPSGRHLLLPQGTRALGRYEADLASGDTRLLVSWHRLILPDGRFFEIPVSAAADVHGATGLSDRTNRHLARALTSTLLLSILGAGSQLSQPTSTSGTYGAPSAGQVAAGAVGQQISHLSTNLLERDLAAKPTLTIRPGTAFGIVLQEDVVFASPYAPAADEATP